MNEMEQVTIEHIFDEYNTLILAHYGKKDFQKYCDEFFEVTKPHYTRLNLSLLRWECERDCKWIWKRKEGQEKIFAKITTLVHRTKDFYTNPCIYRTNDDPNRHLCTKECDKCIGKKHWTKIIANAPNHFVDDNNSVYFITDVNNGGFGGRVYHVTLEDGSEFDCGLWHNGECTDEVAEQIQKGKKELANS